MIDNRWDDASSKVGGGGYRDPDFSRFKVNLEDDLMMFRTNDGLGIATYSGVEFARMVHSGAVPKADADNIRRYVNEQVAQVAKKSAARTSSSLPLLDSAGTEIRVMPFGVLVSADSVNRTATFNSDEVGDVEISQGMVVNLLGALSLAKVIEGKRANNAIYALRGGQAEEKPEDVVETMIKQIKNDDDPMKAAGAWLTLATNAVGDLIKELTKEDES